MTIQYAPTNNWYENATSAEAIFIDHREIGDVVKMPGAGGAQASYPWLVILTVAMRPYANARFHDRSDALAYMQLVHAATIPHPAQ